MRFPPELEERVLGTLNPRQCVVFSAAGERPLIYRDNLTISLHRYLWTKVRGPLARDVFLIRTSCSTPGCVNPWHHELSAAPLRRRRELCPNGHRYDPGTDLPGKLRCARCAAARLDRRRAAYTLGGTANAAKTHCPHGHRLSGRNVYLWTDGKGRVHRKCRACTISRSAAVRQAMSEGAGTHEATPGKDLQ